MDYSKITLGELLSSENETIKRNAISILKQLQKKDKHIEICSYCGKEIEMKSYPLMGAFLCDECWERQFETEDNPATID